ncbi:universal stress protein [Leptolyngbya sp. AN02str]|uniref:universal stress protein n=1 Tax=Leptolyngbya sp. AN02str TaxID=3423363 RepID=UPI003D319CA4
MFNKILVPISHSQPDQLLVNRAIELAQTVGSQLIFLHVLSTEEEGSPDVSLVGVEAYASVANEIATLHREEWIAYEHHGNDMLQAHCQLAAAAGVTAEFTQHYGNVERVICEVAQTQAADLIVMGRRGHSGLKEFFAGSVSNYVLHHANCPVLVLQGTLLASPAGESAAAAVDSDNQSQN